MLKLALNINQSSSTTHFTDVVFYHIYSYIISVHKVPLTTFQVNTLLYYENDINRNDISEGENYMYIDSNDILRGWKLFIQIIVDDYTSNKSQNKLYVDQNYCGYTYVVNNQLTCWTYSDRCSDQDGYTCLYLECCDFLTLNVLDSRNALCALNYISTVLFLIVESVILQFLNKVLIIKTKELNWIWILVFSVIFQLYHGDQF